MHNKRPGQHNSVEREKFPANKKGYSIVEYYTDGTYRDTNS